MKIKNFEVEKIKSLRGREFIVENHYSKTCHSRPMCWGLFNNNELLGVCGFATPISERVRKYIWKKEHEDEMSDKTTELHRLVTKDKCPTNTETYFISRALKGLKEYRNKYKAVISFADSSEGHKGTIYQASNAIYYGTGGSSVCYQDKNGALRPIRQSGENISKKEAKNKGWTVLDRGHKHRYLFLLPDKYEKNKDIKDKLDIEEQQYPKEL